jgi:hypothetical protein
LNQCGVSVGDLLYTERLIYETLADAVTRGLADATPLSFVQLFYEIVAVDAGARLKLDVQSIVGKLEVIQCQFEFTRFRADVLALALLSTAIHERLLFTSSAETVSIAELQYYCQMNEAEFWECRRMMIEYLAMYETQPTKLPRLQLSWSVSRRTLHKMKPSTRAAQDLEPIIEDDDGSNNSAGEDSDDSSIFDSETDEIIGEFTVDA